MNERCGSGCAAPADGTGVAPDAGWRMEAVAPIELHRWWPLVRPGMEVVRARARQAWWPEDIYAAAAGGRATLYVGSIDGRFAGAAVVCIERDPCDNDPVLLVWAAFTVHRAALGYGLRDLQRIARAQGIGRLRFVSPRPGFARRMAAAGFRVTQRIYEKVI